MGSASGSIRLHSIWLKFDTTEALTGLPSSYLADVISGESDGLLSDGLFPCFKLSTMLADFTCVAGFETKFALQAPEGARAGN